jgi:3-deoxy-D-manno-octulosonic acid kinase
MDSGGTASGRLLRMRPLYRRLDNQHILYDGSALDRAGPELFESAAWEARGGLRGEARGRGSAYLVADAERSYVLRHYRRGGLVARVSADRYVWTGLRRSRAWREWHLLASLYTQGLPVPRPIAARVVRRHLTYQADLLTERIAEATSLAAHLTQRALTPEGWAHIGSCISRFHTAGVRHADLNAHNILLDAAGRVYLIDFDRGSQQAPARGWQQANLTRLRRSIDKLAGQTPFHYNEGDWAALLRGYDSTAAPRAAALSPSARNRPHNRDT